MTTVTVNYQRDDSRDGTFTEDLAFSKEELPVQVQIVYRTLSSEFAFDKITRVAVAMTFESSLDELLIMKALLREPASESCDALFRYKTLRERFTLSPKTARRLHEEVYEKIPYRNTQKMRDDICFISSVLKDTVRDIMKTGCYKGLLRVISAAQQQEDEDNIVKEQYSKKLVEIQELKYLLATQKIEFEQKIKYAGNEIHALKNEYEDLVFYGKQELRYLQDWENCRKYQNDTILQSKEDKFNNIISTSKTKIDQENIIHHEISDFIVENMEDLQNSIQTWMRLYDEKLHEIEVDISYKKAEWEQLTEEHIKLANHYEAHRKEMDEYIERREERRKQAELEAKRNRAAIKLQAWWRGTMVRKKLGPFKVVKGKKDKGKGKGKKGQGKKKK